MSQTIIADNQQPPHFVLTKGLTQVMLGAPQTVYTGGLLRATVRYFDPDRARPGVPEDVAALVDKLGSDVVGVQLVNLNRTETRNVIIQAGAFGEHQFTKVQFQEVDSEEVHQSGLFRLMQSFSLLNCRLRQRFGWRLDCAALRIRQATPSLGMGIRYRCHFNKVTDYIRRSGIPGHGILSDLPDLQSSNRAICV